MGSSAAAEAFHITTTTLLSLLLPVSFLLIARFSCYNYLIADQDTSASSSSSTFLNSVVNITLYGVVSVVTVSALVNGIMVRPDLAGPLVRPKRCYNRLRSCGAWMLICCLQICVRFGAELDGSRSAVVAAVVAGISDLNDDRAAGSGSKGSGLLIRAGLFLGLYEIMFHWLSMVVRPVVDSAIFGRVRDEWWVQRVVTGLSFGTLWWWWGLNEEVESLAVVAAAKWNRVSHAEDGFDLVGLDLVGWWLYYVTFIIGMVRVAKGAMWVGLVLLCERREVVISGSVGDDDLGGVEDKV
ncbi:hypothetical protein LINGRAHAP2_LOCUS15935 [Linum grandiflorum]